MPGLLQRRDTVVPEAARPAPHDAVAVRELEPPRPLAALQAAEQEHGRNAERDRDDWLPPIALVLVLVQRQARAGLVPIDQTSVRRELGELRGRCRAAREAQYD